MRHGRMMVSPFTFYRGAARIMAADLKDTPTAGLDVQLCGDAHLSNFGMFASPERDLVFDLNDFDETLPGPFEYDVKRMAASFTIAARNNGFTKAQGRAATIMSAKAYRETMAKFAEMGTMDVWYATDVGTRDPRRRRSGRRRPEGRGEEGGDRRPEERAEERAEGARRATACRRCRSSPSTSTVSTASSANLRSWFRCATCRRSTPATRSTSSNRWSTTSSAAYRATLPDDRRELLERFEIVDMARKVVGVGSVGTRAFIVLLQGRDQQDPLFLQVKEATTSVLEDHLPKSRYEEPGERVVQGQRLMQATSDIFLGWTKGVEANRHMYWRQLRDMKGSAIVEAMAPGTLTFYAKGCGETLARAHARSGDPVALAAYLGSKDRFEQSIADFSERYADQNEQDYRAFCDAVSSGRLEAVEGV